MLSSVDIHELPVFLPQYFLIQSTSFSGFKFLPLLAVANFANINSNEWFFPVVYDNHLLEYLYMGFSICFPTVSFQKKCSFIVKILSLLRCFLSLSLSPQVELALTEQENLDKCKISSFR